MMDRNDYRIGLICALPIELAAAESMLDDVHPDLPRQPNHNNTYTLGRMGKHNVVIACLPSGFTGTITAANVASELRFSFPSIRFGLMVGIAGGVPGECDIRLGDVVVSQPSGASGAVVQYDHGKTIQNGKFVMTGLLDRPPTVLLTAVSKLQAKHLREGSRLKELIFEAGKKFPTFRQNCVPPGEDQLFAADYDHPLDSKTCANCDPSRRINREDRTSIGPVVHYGLIASGNQVMRHAIVRDKIAKQPGILCFEMEAAGLMNSFPCLVIRGISDYADSHKNKAWQPYAAVAAAAYAKDLLDAIPSDKVIQTRSAADTIDIQDNLSLSLYGSRPHVQTKSEDAIVPREAWEVQKGAARDWPKLLSRISTYDQELTHWRLSRKRLQGTVQWFINHERVQEWITKSRSRSLWCSGGVGSGKTMICSGLIDHLKQSLPEVSTRLIFFYCDTFEGKIVTADRLFRSLTKQLLQRLQSQKKAYPENIVTMLEYFFNPGGPEPDFDDMKEILSTLAVSFPEAIYLIDGIDEIEVTGLPAVISTFHQLIGLGSKVFMASREELGMNIRPNFTLRVQITPLDNHTDIQQYISSQITKKTEEERYLSSDDKVMAKVKETLNKEAKGMYGTTVPRGIPITDIDRFLWVRLQIEALWLDCICDEQIVTALDHLPPDLPATYDRCVARIPSMTRDIGVKTLRWVMSANRPLDIHELQEAISFSLTDSTWDSSKLISFSIIMASCANLVTLEESDQTIRLTHPSVKQYLLGARTQGPNSLRISASEAILECGEECVNYLSFTNFRLQLERKIRSTTNINMSISATIGATLPYPKFANKISGFLGGKASTRSSRMPTFQSYVTKPEAVDERKFALLEYARQNWANHTKTISSKSKTWDKFVALALELRTSWGKHPWKSGGDSYVSHLHALFIWATREGHVPLLELALREGEGSRLKIFCDLPCVSDGLPALHIASRQGNLVIVSLLSQVCNVNALGPFLRTPLHFAVEKNHLTVAQLLLACEGINVHALAHGQIVTSYLGSKEVKETALSIAAAMGFKEMVSLLLSAYATIIPPGVSEGNPIIVASYTGHTDILRDLLLKFPVPDEVVGVSLQCALYYGRKETGMLLLEKTKIDPMKQYRPFLKAPLILATEFDSALLNTIIQNSNFDVNCKGSDDLRTPLSYAAEHKRHTAVVLLLQKKADRTLSDKDGRTPLSYAASNGDLSVVTTLLDFTIGQPTNQSSKMLENSRAYCHISDKKKRRPLSYAAEHGHEEVVKILLKYDYLLDRLDVDHRTPISYAAEQGHETIIELLLRAGAQVDTPDFGYLSPLSYAIIEGQSGAATRLLAHNASTEADYNRRTALSYAAEHGNEEIVKLLLDRKTSLDPTDAEGPTSHVYAADREHEQRVSKYRNHGISVNLPDLNGRTPMSHAVEQGDEAITTLLQAGVRKNDFDLSHRTPLMHAAMKGHTEVVRLLLENSSVVTADRRERKKSSYAAEQANAAVAQVLSERSVVDNGDYIWLRLRSYTAGALEESDALQDIADHCQTLPVDLEGRTALSYAAEYGDVKIVKLLLEAREKEARGLYDGWKSAISYATQQGHNHMVSALREAIQSNAGTHMRGLTPLSYAAMYGHTEMTNLLRGNIEQMTGLEFQIS